MVRVAYTNCMLISGQRENLSSARYENELQTLNRSHCCTWTEHTANSRYGMQLEVYKWLARLWKDAEGGH